MNELDKELNKKEAGGRKENKMGTLPVNKLLISISLPIMISMLVQALYNVVDSIFVAQVSENALTAVSLAFPVQSLMIAVGVGTGIGINSFISRRLGEKRSDDANAATVNGLFLAALSWALFAVLGIFFSRPFFETTNAAPEVVEMGIQYLSIVTVASFGLFFSITTERFMQATGRTIYNMAIQGTGAALNIILDPIFIFGYFGLPAMGVAGAAIATVIGQIVAMIIGLWLNFKKNPDLTIKIKGFKPDGRIIKEIYRVGFPSIVMQSIISIMTLGLNFILIMFSQTAVSVFGIYFKLQSFIFMPVLGMSNGVISIAGFNYGAKNRERIVRTVKLAIIYSVSIMAAGTLLFELFPAPLLRLFNASENLMSIGVPALRIISSSFVFAGAAIVFSSVFQAIGNGVLSLIMSVSRQLVVILPVAYLMAVTIGLNAVWLAFPISEIVSTIMSIFMYRYVYNKRIKDLSPGVEACMSRP